MRHKQEPNTTRRLVALLVLTAVVVSVPHARAAQVDLLILAGQSNMVGQANTTASIPGVDPADSEVAYYYDVTNTAGSFADDSGQTFGPLQPWRLNASTTRLGPEMSLGRDLHDAGLNPAIIKVAIGGANIAHFLPGAVDYNALRAAVLDGVAEIESAGDTVNLLGMGWLQGESDVISTSRADAYATNLASFIGGFRSELDGDLPGRGFADLDAFLIEPADWKNGSNPGIATAANVAKVDQALIDFGATDANAWFIPTDDFTTFGDGLIHFGAEDQLTLGSRLASSVLATVVPEPSCGVMAWTLLGVAAARRRRPQR